MGKRSKRERQEDLWIPSGAIVETPRHAFYERLNEVLSQHGFDRRIEHLCQRYYRGPLGRPSIAPGVYFRMLLIGYFEGIGSERGIAWRVADSLSLRKFLAYGLDETTPDHSTISRTRRLYWLSTHQAVFAWVLKVLAGEGLVRGDTIAVDATTLEANAAMRSIVRRDTGEGYQEYLKLLAAEAGLENPTRVELARFDRKRKRKKTSNRDWKHPHDPDARIAKMKDGRTHLAHKAEHAVDLSSGALLAVTLQPADQGDTTTIFETLDEAQVMTTGAGIGHVKEAVLDKGYHSGHVVVALNERNVRGYVSEPDRGRRSWKGKRIEQKQVYANRRRIRGERGQRLQKKRAELAERSFAHMCETGGMRRVHLRGRTNILKRLVVHGAGFNLSLIMRALVGAGTPRQAANSLLRALLELLSRLLWRHRRFRALRMTVAPLAAASRLTSAPIVL